MSQNIQGDSDFYVVSGTMNPNAPSYIEREADRELLEKILQGNFCYVLAPRQTGKSSLKARLSARLKKQGVKTANIDLTGIGGEKKKEDAEKWYNGITDCIAKELGVRINIEKWWDNKKSLPALRRLMLFFNEVVLENVEGQVVIFVDEIDYTINLPFTDDFFAAIRACFNARATHPEYQKLNFVLLGVASPSELIKDVSKTPFNIGCRIDLTDFTLEEARPLARHLAPGTVYGEGLLERILYWTGGQPYLTQKLCHLATQSESDTGEYTPSTKIDRIVENHLLEPDANAADEHFNYIRKRLESKNLDRRKLLKLYRLIYKGKTIVDDPLSPFHTELKLSGLVALGKNRRLIIRNRIYENIFSLKWIKAAMPTTRKLYIVVFFFFLLLFFIVIWYTKFLPVKYIKVIKLARDEVPTTAYEKLRKIPGYSNKADKILADYWERRALWEEVQDRNDRAFLCRLMALKKFDTISRRRRLAFVSHEYYSNLLCTYRTEKPISSVVFSPDGSKIFVGCDDGSARLYETDSGVPMGDPINHGQRISIACFRPKNNTVNSTKNNKGIVPKINPVITGGDDGIIRFWHAKSGENMEITINHREPITTAAFSPDGSMLLTGGSNGTVRFWQTDTGQEKGAPIRHRTAVFSAAFSTDGKRILTGSNDGMARLWHIDSRTLLVPPLYHKRIITNVAFNPDGRIILTFGDDGSVKSWKSDNGKLLDTKDGPGENVPVAAFSPDSKIFITGFSNGMGRLWQTDTGQPLGNNINHDEEILSAAFSPDGKRVLTGGVDGTARLWKVDTYLIPGIIIRHSGGISAAVFSPDGKTLLTGGENGIVRLWGSRTGSLSIDPLNLGRQVTSAAFSPDSQSVLVGGKDGVLRLWAAGTGKLLVNAIYHGHWVSSAGFSPDGELVFAGGSDGTASLWWKDSAQPHAKSMKHNSWISDAAFSPDGKILFTSGHDSTARLWQVDTGKQIGKSLKHNSWVSSVAFSPDGKTLLTGSLDGTVQLWDVYDHHPLGKPMKHELGVSEADFTPDGQHVILATDCWINRGVISSGSLEYKTSYPLPGAWIGAYHYLDKSGDRLQVALRLTRSVVAITIISLEPYNIPILNGEPDQLLKEWERKFGLILNENGEFENKH